MDKIRITSQLSALLLTGGFTVSAGAVSVDLTAVFRPDPAKPMHNEFKNTTPQGGYCKDHPAYCADGIFSIALPIRFRSIAPILPEHAERQGAMFRTPSYWKEVTVIHDGTGKAETVKMRVNGIGAAYTIKEPLPGGVWDASWVNAPAPCNYGGVGYGSAYYYAFFWRVPANAGSCAKRAYQPIPETLGFAYQDVGFSYELVTPDPLKMSTGTYRGVMNYTVGPQQDFDMGDVMLPDDDLINLNFTLTVEHTLKVDIPPGGDRVELVPEGGWQSWLAQGRKPTRLFRDQTFNISSSTRFKMHLECNIPGLFDCMIRDPVSQRAAVVQLSISLPNGLTDTNGQPVKRRPLHVGHVNAQTFNPAFYVERAPGILHFEIAPYYVNYMLKPGEASKYSGSFTVVWDSDIG
ncbi:MULTISPECIES: hypothetical protein [Pseudomonas]|uniref:Uncharacterized protein n=2 Tax=Pseudomonas TaxID=286 RepID=A0ACC5MLP0_9PSED|nr:MULTISPECIES: hypothetical protein [Pseudomonas]ATE79473.1 hypothetical protein CNN82_24750 [Pseudomonas frederiksbergensis]MBB2889480.1 hypothetical protein [Pseudomonas umsongensis]NMN77609.1 hypothetical protein [Pseudomonas sp. KD5]